MDLLGYVRQIDIETNRFKNNNFFIWGIESLEDTDQYIVGDVQITFKDNNLIIHCTHSNWVHAIFLAVRIESNSYGYDPKSEITIDNEKKPLNIKKINYIEKFKIIKNAIGEFPCNIVIKYYDNDAFSYNKSLIWFIVDDSHEDTFYYENELKRREEMNQE